MRDENTTSTFVPLDFNSLRSLEGQTLKLSNYYIDYAFHSEGIEPSDGMDITFYDKFWTSDPSEITCLDGLLKKNTGEQEPWAAEIKGRIYTTDAMPRRTRFSSFIGAHTCVLSADGRKADQQKLGPNFGKKDQLGGVALFAFAPDTAMPDFSKMIGMDARELHDFFMFSDRGMKLATIRPDGKWSDDTLCVRGGGNTGSDW